MPLEGRFPNCFDDFAKEACPKLTWCVADVRPVEYVKRIGFLHTPFNANLLQLYHLRAPLLSLCLHTA